MIKKIAAAGLVAAIAATTAHYALAQTFRFERGDPRGNVEGKRASCEVYARIAKVQTDANARYRCGFTGPRWVSNPIPHFRWCRFVPRGRVAEEQRARAQELQQCFDRLGDFDDNRW